MNTTLPQQEPRLGAGFWASMSGQSDGVPEETSVGQREPVRSGAKLPQSELADLTAQLAIMTKSGVDLATSLKTLERQCKRPAAAEVIGGIREAVVSGATFSQALRQYEHSLGPTYVATVAAAEASGQMASVLGQLAQLQRNELRLARTVKSLLAYPVLLASISSLVIAALVLFVLPQFASIFEQYETPLPTITQVLIFCATELRVRWWLYLPLAAGVTTAAVIFRCTARGRRGWDWLLIHGWLMKDVCRGLAVGRACRLLGLMIESGVPLLEGLGLTRQALTNVWFQDLFDHLEHEVISGNGLGAALADAEIVPPSAREMIATAERSGNLGEVTRLLGEHFEEEGEAKMRQVVAVMEPLITVGMGAVVALVVLAVMLPMFDLATFAQK
jgi:type II secretory pathway component PulF